MIRVRAGDRVCQRRPYGAGLVKVRYGTVLKVGARGARVRFDGERNDLWVAKDLYPSDETRTERTRAPEAGAENGEANMAKAKAIPVGSRVQFKHARQLRRGVVVSVNDRVVQVTLDDGGTLWPKPAEVTVLAAVETPTAPPPVVSPASTRVPAPLPAASSAPTSVAASNAVAAVGVAPEPTVASARPATPAPGVAVAPGGSDWLQELAAYAVGLLKRADADVQASYEARDKALVVAREAERELDAAKLRLEKANEEARACAARAVDLEQRRDALRTLVRTGRTP